jgi:hypothetical protein
VQEGLRDLSRKEEIKSTQEVVRERILTSIPLKVHQHRKVTTLGETNRNPETVRETQIRGNKARNLSKKKVKLETL